MQLFCSALGFGNAIGLNAVISRALGEGDREKVKRAADSAIFLAVCAWALICVLCLAGVRRYFDWQSGGDPVIAAYGRDYLTVCMLFSFGQMGQWGFDRFVMASGRSHLFLFTLSAASLTNLILDPIFIFGLFGVPGLIFAAALQGLGQGAGSMVLTMSRQAVLPVVFALAVRGFGSLTLIWTAFILAECAGIPLALALWKRARRAI